MKQKKTGLLVLRPVKIENYALLMTSLKMMIEKYKDKQKSTKFIEEVFPLEDLDLNKCMLVKKEKDDDNIDIHRIVNGYLEHKIIMRNDRLLQEGIKKAKEDIAAAIKKLKEEDRLKGGVSHKIHAKDALFIESNFDRSVSIEFSDPFLEYVHGCFTEKYEIEETHERKIPFEKEICFLERSYRDHITKFMEEKGMKDSITEYVRARYSRDEYFIESYQGRYLFAEVYVHVRCGMVRKALDLIDAFSSFFDQMAPSLKDFLVIYFNNQYVNKIEYEKIRNIKSDHFKQLLYGIVCNVDKTAELFGSFEDFLWHKMLQAKNTDDILRVNRSLSVDGCKLLVLVFCKKYRSAMNVLYTGDFSIIEIFYVMRELSKAKKDIVLYSELIFSLIKHFKSIERKLKLIDTLNIFNNYEAVVAEMIVKYETYDLLGLKKDICHLNRRIVDQVAAILYKKNDRAKLLQLYYLFNEDINIVSILNEYLVDYIVKNKRELFDYTEIISFYSKRNISRETEKMKILNGLANFKKTRDINVLRNTGVFCDTQPSLLEEIKPVIEKLLPLMVTVIEEEKEDIMAKELFELCSSINLGERSTAYVGERLVLFL